MANNSASDRVEAALTESIQELEDYKEGDILMDWIVIAFVANANDEEQSGYPMLFPNGNMPTYRAMGLLEYGLNNLKEE